MAVTIRPAAPADAEQILLVHVTSIRTICARDYRPDQIDMWIGSKRAAQYVQAMGRGEVFLVAELDARIVGFASLHGGEVNAVYLHPDQVGKKIGRRLLSAVEGEARARGVSELRLMSTLTAVGFYEACGYRNDGPATHPMPPSDLTLECVKFWKEL